MGKTLTLRGGVSGETARRNRRLIQIVILLAVYFVTARLGLMLGAVSGFATFVWPPSGIALVALFIFGFELWPAIALGAFLVNWSLGAPIGVAIGIAAGNTIEPIVGAYFLRRLGFLASLENLKSVLCLVIPAALLSPVVSATIGVSSLFLGGKLPQIAFGATWLAWWSGDVMGILIVAPFLLVWSSRPSLIKEPRQIAEAILLFLVVLLCSLLIFTDWVVVGDPVFPRPFCIFPVMMLVAVRWGQRGVATANLLLAAIIIYMTAIGGGRFWTGALTDSLLQVHIFLAILIVSKMVFASAVAERKRLYVEAQNAIRARDEFLSIASHELKTPLTSLRLQLQMANRSLESGQNIAPSAEKLAKVLAVSNGQVDRLTSLVEDLLDVSKISVGKLSLHFEKLNLCDLVRDVTEQFSAVAADAKCSVDLSLCDEAIGYWDRTRFEQIVVNLLSNGIKYASGKPIVITVACDTQNATLIVEDLGPGIPKEQHSKIFERFERATTSRNISGLGLGLFIVSEIVRAHRGSVCVESESDQGTRFIVKLPLNLAHVKDPVRPDVDVPYNA